jgi:hypothetical protein
MKTAILTAALVALLTAANAEPVYDTVGNPIRHEQSLNVTIVQPSSDVINFRVSNPEMEKVVLKIYNGKKVKVFHKNVKSYKELSVKCDMSNCEAGTYTAVVEKNGQETLRKVITLN